MAKAKDLAALAGLAGLAYAYNKSKGDSSKTDTGDETNRLLARKPAPVTDAEEEPRRKITDYMKKAPSDNAGAVSPAPVIRSAPKVAPAKPAVVADEPAGLTAPVSSANRTDQLANLSRAVKREDKTKRAAQGDFKDVTRDASGDSPTAIKAKKLYDTLDKKAGAATSSAQKTDALKVASRAAAAADRQRKLAKASSYKSGGMASSASKRADGIASRGKTKCKMY